jgi:hypothetical protein
MGWGSLYVSRWFIRNPPLSSIWIESSCLYLLVGRLAFLFLGCIQIMSKFLFFCALFASVVLFLYVCIDIRLWEHG